MWKNCCCSLGFHYFKFTEVSKNPAGWSICQHKPVCLLTLVVAGQVHEDPGVLAAPFQSQKVLLQLSLLTSLVTRGTCTALLAHGRGRDCLTSLVFLCPVSQPSAVGKDCLFDPSIQLKPVVDSSLSPLFFLETMWFYHAATEIRCPCLKLELDAEESKSERWAEERQCNDRMFHMPLNF